MLFGILMAPQIESLSQRHCFKSNIVYMCIMCFEEKVQML